MPIVRQAGYFGRCECSISTKTLPELKQDE
jgi:hypothetical protein